MCAIGTPFKVALVPVLISRSSVQSRDGGFGLVPVSDEFCDLAQNSVQGQGGIGGFGSGDDYLFSSLEFAR